MRDTWARSGVVYSSIVHASVFANESRYCTSASNAFAFFCASCAASSYTAFFCAEPDRAIASSVTVTMAAATTGTIAQHELRAQRGDSELHLTDPSVAVS